MAVEQAATGGTGGGTARRVLAPLLDPRTLTATIYLLVSMFIGLTWHLVLAVGLSVGVATLIIWVGIFVLALTLLAWRGGAWLERRWLRLMLGVQIPDPYRPLPSGSLWRRARVLASDPATWKDLAYLVLLFPLGLVWLVVTTTLWTFALGLLTAPVWYWIPNDGGAAALVNGDRRYLVLDTLPEALLAGVVGAALVVAAAWAVKGMAIAHGAVAQALLGPSQNQLQARVEALQASRDRAVDSAEAERRRIERDLHDGAQQRLVALAMDLGMARSKLETDPAAATALVGEAHEEAKRALAELAVGHAAHVDGHRGTGGQRLERGAEPVVAEDGRMDAARELPQLLDGGLRLLARLRDQLEGALGVAREAGLGDAERHGHRDHPLLRAVVQVALDAAALLIGRGDDALARGPQVVDPLAQRPGAAVLGRLTREAKLGPHRPQDMSAAPQLPHEAP